MSEIFQAPIVMPTIQKNLKSVLLGEKEFKIKKISGENEFSDILTLDHYFPDKDAKNNNKLKKMKKIRLLIEVYRYKYIYTILFFMS